MFDAPPLIEIVLGALVAAIAMGVCWFGPATVRRPMALWAAGASLVFLVRGEAGLLLVLAVMVALSAERLADDRARPAIFALALVAVTLAATGTDSWTLVLGATVAGLLLWPLLAWMLRVHTPVTLAFLLAATAAGIYVNVPDTEQITVHAAGLGVIAVLQLAIVQTRAEWRPQALAVVGVLIMAAGASGAIGRPSSFVAVVGALGVLIAEPVAGSLRRNTRAKPWVMVILHGAASITVSRIGGRAEADEAALIVLGAIAALVLILTILPRDRMALAGTNDTSPPAN